MALVWRLQSDNRGQGTNLGLIAVEGYAEFFHSLFLAVRRQTLLPWDICKEPLSV